MTRVDLNCDLGESYGNFKVGMDEQILPFITSANIACGFHAGDPTIMRKTVLLALKHNVSIGAHPGLPDLLGFGRRQMDITAQEAYDMVLYQVGALKVIAESEGGKLRHVKPHGALYNMAAIDKGLAEAIANVILKIDSEMILFGLAGSELVNAGMKAGIQVAQEVFADRTYQRDGTLTPRRHSDALITDDSLALHQVIRMVKEGKVRSIEGTELSIQADTICIHGDGPYACNFASFIRNELVREGITVQSF
ncbi:MAG: 5-oxoprolinase subunit PxpA [Bacillota bacterium]|nr:5-oxoprolinase subunit PxpA [Bacillota bacterium]